MSRPGLTQANCSRSLVRAATGKARSPNVDRAWMGRRAWSRQMNADADVQRHRRCDEDCWPGMTAQNHGDTGMSEHRTHVAVLTAMTDVTVHYIVVKCKM